MKRTALPTFPCPASAMPARTGYAILLLAAMSLPGAAHAGLLDGLIDVAKGTVSAEKAPPFDFSTPPSQQSANFVDVVRGANFRDIRKVGIVNFTVEFALYKEASASGGGLSNAFGVTEKNTRSVEKAIPAPDVSTLQAITDRLYQQMVADFTAMGIEVVPFDTLKATPHFAELSPAQHASPWLTDTKDTQSVFIAPTGMPLYLDNPERADFLQGLGMSFGTNTRMKEVMMTYDLKQEVHLLSVNMVVDFATVKSSGNSISAYGAHVSGADVHHLHAGNTSYRFVSTTQPEFIYVKLKQPLVSDKGLWSNSTQSTDKQSNMTGTGNSTTTTEVGKFDSALYYKRSEEMLNAAREMFAAELSRAK